MLNGKPIKEHDFITRAFNMFSPIHFNLDHSEGRQFLFDSGYDLRIATYFSPDGDDLTDHPELRSKYQRLIGEQNLELKLARLSRNPKSKESLEQMYFDIRSGLRGDYQTSDYWHNQRIRQIINEAREIAWKQLWYEEEVINLRQSRLEKKALRNLKSSSTGSIQPLLTMYK